MTAKQVVAIAAIFKNEILKDVIPSGANFNVGSGG